MQEDNDVIRIGFSPMTPAQLLMELWSGVQAVYPDIKFQIIPFENTPENVRLCGSEANAGSVPLRCIHSSQAGDKEVLADF